MQENSMDISAASGVSLTALCWIAFATSKNLAFSVLTPEQSYLVWRLVLTGKLEKILLVQLTYG